MGYTHNTVMSEPGASAAVAAHSDGMQAFSEWRAKSTVGPGKLTLA